MDKTDIQILDMLQENSRVSNSEIARQIGMVPSGVLERIRKLEENGFIQNYTVNLNPEKIDMGLLVYIFIKIDDMESSWESAKNLAKNPEVMELHHIAGEDCYLLKVRAKNNKAISTFLKEKLGPVKGLVSTRTTIVLESVKESSKVYIKESLGD